jgi:putative glycosyl hydrolase-like family 15 (GHL15) protein/VCBS repeat protein
MIDFSNKLRVLKVRIVLFLLCFVLPLNLIQASTINKLNEQKYPKKANYFLSWSLTDDNVKKLAKWDVLILDMENQINNPEKLEQIRILNPNVTILAYVPAEEIAYDSINCECTQLRKQLAEYSPESWYLHDPQGNRLSFWEKSLVMNISDEAQLKNGERWNTYLADFVKIEILSTNLWDGVYYDNVSHDMSWLNNGDIDLNNDGRKDSASYIDSRWKSGMTKLLRLTREGNENSIIVGNSASDLDFHEYLNGRMFENFPTPWELDGEWDSVSDLYLNKFPERSLDPHLYVINSNTENTGVMDNYRKMRFGLTTTLLGEGYYSFDFGDQSHTQTWWYDEYESFLGDSQSEAYNLLDQNDHTIKPGLWRRDFESGIVVVNSTNQEQTHVFFGESFEKINGNQDRRINNGSKINWLRIAPKDGIVLLKTNTNIANTAYINGSFFRVFNENGLQERNGFFTFEEDYQSKVEILKADLDNDGNLETLVNGNGSISIYKNGQKKISFNPYGENFKEHISIAVGDLDNDGNKEIITGAGPGGGPHVRVFNKDGELINQFFAYESDFYGGISIAVANINNDKNQEIVTSPGKGGHSQIKTFTQYGHLLKDFFAYDYNSDYTTKVVTNDIDYDGISEILVSISDF